ncbi:MAG: class I SAM-dependent methyltransferase [Stellaceae bacterium]
MSETGGSHTNWIPASQYDRYRGSMFSDPYVPDMVERVARLAPKRVLETAAGTGTLARALASTLPDCRIVATDLNPAMLDQAAANTSAKTIEWRQADAQALPFEAAEFDAVICQLSVVFFADKAKAFAEAHRVLTPGGHFIFSVQDRIEENEFSALTARAVAKLFPADPPSFLARIPHGYHDVRTIRSSLARVGFTHVETETVTKRSRAGSARELAIGFCQGSPLRAEIEARDASMLQTATEAAAEAIAAKFGRGPIDGKMQAHVITAAR